MTAYVHYNINKYRPHLTANAVRHYYKHQPVDDVLGKQSRFIVSVINIR
jgi:hypothetical protein